MTLRITPRFWYHALVAAVGVAPFSGCGGATTLNHDDEAEGGTQNGGAAGRGKGGSSNVAGKGGRNLGGHGLGGNVNTAGAAGSAPMAGNAGSGPVNAFPCLSPTPYPFAGTGYELCEGDFLHRTGSAACPAGGGSRTDAWCPGTQQILVCEANGGQCASSNCDSDADCLDGFHCIGNALSNACGPSTEFACQTPADTCAGAADCEGCSGCVASPSGRSCQQCCAIGRPFLVGGQARSAALAEREDWQCEGLVPELDSLSPEQRRILTQNWQASALMEHASIAAFSRFVLDLMSLGAPASLVESATHAMLEEAAHTKACFALASHYAGRSLGPSTLSVSGSLDQRTLHEIVVTTVLEGCIGETVAALEAAEALEHATDPAVRRALSQITRDELGHAALAYRFVRWAIATFGQEIEHVVHQTYRDALRDAAPAAADAAPDLDLLAHGMLSAPHKAELRRRVLGELIGPVLPALLAA